MAADSYGSRSNRNVVFNHLHVCKPYVYNLYLYSFLTVQSSSNLQHSTIYEISSASSGSVRSELNGDMIDRANSLELLDRAIADRSSPDVHFDDKIEHDCVQEVHTQDISGHHILNITHPAEVESQNPLFGPTNGQNFLVSGSPLRTVARRSSSPVEISGKFTVCKNLRDTFTFNR